ncbi:MAG: C-GCAxxG-C-C family protein [Christensenellaceae bacterium]|jgi:C_GCAxxG_C_C family probable redox protein|nr:C-GCAxxG-C-C family protein [Christensenellaceae bacterium]
MTKVAQAVECFNEGFNCAQAILSTYCEELGLGRETALTISCGLGAGMGRLGHVCGAVSGAYLLIGLKYGQLLPDDKGAKEKTYTAVQKFTKKFEERHGSTICKELLGVDLMSGDKALVSERVSAICPKMVRDAAGIVEEMLF